MNVAYRTFDEISIRGVSSFVNPLQHSHAYLPQLSKAGFQGAAAPWRGVGQGSLGGFHSPPFPLFQGWGGEEDDF